MKTKLYILLFLLSPLLWRGAGGEVLAQTNAVSFSQADRDLLYAMDKRLVRMEAILEQHEKRFDAIEKRMDKMETHADWQFYILIFGMFTLVGFILWDRRTFLKPFETKVGTLAENATDEKAKMQTLLAALRELAAKDTDVAQVLKTHNLL
ncbi:MAG: hypothetical protein ACYDEC_05080 [Bacteroidia bacterium]